MDDWGWDTYTLILMGAFAVAMYTALCVITWGSGRRDRDDGS